MTNKPFYLLVDGNHSEYQLFHSKDKAMEVACEDFDELNFDNFAGRLDELEEELMMGYDMTVEPITFYDDKVE